MTLNRRPRRALRRIANDLRNARHLEAYSLSIVAIGLMVYRLIGDPKPEATDTVILACLALLVFSTTRDRSDDREPSLDTILQNREAFGAFNELLEGATELWMYAPTGVNILLRHSGDLKSWIAKGGRTRIVVQDPSSPMVEAVRAQLDVITDFDSTLNAALATLSKNALPGRMEFRLLPFNPGFSLVIFDPQGK